MSKVLHHNPVNGVATEAHWHQRKLQQRKLEQAAEQPPILEDEEQVVEPEAVEVHPDTQPIEVEDHDDNP